METIYKIFNSEMKEPTTDTVGYSGEYETVFYEYDSVEEAEKEIKEYFNNNIYCEDLVIVKVYRKG